MHIERRSGSLILVMAATLLISTGIHGLPLATTLEPIEPIATKSGLVAGNVLESGVRAWFGVPFAAAPVRELRWRPPQPVSWDGVYTADRFAPKCMQSMRGSNINHYFGHEAISEDCLYLNIWAPPGSAAGDDLPVVVWIYGGGFNVGSASMRNYAGESLAKKGAVYVGVAYRVGAMGFLAHPELTAESPHGASGNYGLLDQVAALEWIRDNIAGFGGDPDRVTISGQSAGSMSLSALQVSPLAADLFHGIVGMSGSAFGMNLFQNGLGKAEQVGLAYQEALGVDSLQGLRNLAADRILAHQHSCGFGCDARPGPIVDGYFLPDHPAALFASGEQHDVPIMIGFTRDEGFSPMGRARTLQQYRELLAENFGDKADELLRAYSASNDAEAWRAARDIARDSSLGSMMRKWAELQQVRGEQPVFAYLFSRVQPYTPGISFDDHDPATAGSYHTADVPYWLETLDSLNLFRETRTYTAYDRQLADLMSDTIIAFASSGNPSAGPLDWPEFSIEDDRIVEFGATLERLYRIADWPNAAQLTLFTDNAPRPAAAPPGQRQSPRD